MLGITKRVVRQIIGDKRTVALIILAPLLIMTLLMLLLGGTDYTPSIAIIKNNLPPAVIEALENQEANIILEETPIFNAKQYLKDNRDVDAVFFMSANGFNITIYESSSKSGTALTAIQNAIASLNPSAQLHMDFVIGNENDSLFDSLGYVFFGVISFFLIFIVSGMALVRERSSGTLERLLMTPVSRRSVIIGYTAGYSFFAVLQSVIIVCFGIFILGLHSEGHIAWVILIMLLLAVSAVSFGKLISIFANTEFQVVQFIPIAIIPQIFFSGIIPLDTIPYHLGNLCYIMPIYYGCAAIKEVMVLGHGIESIWYFILALMVCIIALSALNILALKKYRRL